MHRSYRFADAALDDAGSRITFCIVHTNTVEGYFSVFKRGMKGVHRHRGKQPLHRFLAEFDFRYNNRIKLGVNDIERTDWALKGVVGKRLTYQQSSRSA